MLLLSFCFSSSCHSIHTMEHEFYECPEYLSNTPAEAERTEEYEYEVQSNLWFIPTLHILVLGKILSTTLVQSKRQPLLLGM